MNLINKIKSNKLIKSSLVYTICEMLLKGISFISFPIFSRLMSPNDYGVVNIFSTWVGFIVVFGSLQLNACIPIAKSKFEDSEYEDLKTTILSFTTVLFFILFLISIIFRKNLSHIFELSGNLVILMTVQGFFSFISVLYSTILIQDKKDKKYLMISLISTILNIGISILLVYIMRDNRYMGRILGGVISVVLVGSILYFKIAKGKFLINKDLLKFGLKICLPIVPHILSHQILTNSDRIMLKSFKGDRAVGIYGFAYNIGMMIQIIWSAINNAWVPWYFENLRKDNNDKVLELSRNYIMFFTAITILLIFTTPEIGKILAPKSYWSGIQVVPLIIFSYFFVFLYSFPVNIQFYNEKTNYIPIGTVLAALANIGLNRLFIPKYGLLAATLSTLISYILLFIFHLLIVKYLLKHKDMCIKYYLISTIVVVIAIILFYITMNNLICRYFILFILVLYLYLKRERFKELIKIK